MTGNIIDKKNEKYVNFYSSPVGKIVMVSDGVYLTHLLFGEYESNHCWYDQYTMCESLMVFETVKQWLDVYFSGQMTTEKSSGLCSKIIINLEGSDFQLKIWQLLQEIPYGKTVTYGELARKYTIQNNIQKMSAQAVGQAVGKNPIAIIIPCHRVIGSSGRLVGYAGGIEKKEMLLNIEGENSYGIRQI